MEKLKNYLMLMKIKHYLKNILIFIPLVFSGNAFKGNNLLYTFLGFCVFSLLASAVYIINDYKDIEKDKMHDVKKNRPLASGKVTKIEALVLLFILFLCVITANLYMRI